MADTHEIWNHGVTVVAQHTPHLTQTQNGLFMMPLSWGTVVRQDRGTTNWFHIPIPTPLVADDWQSRAYHAFVRIRLKAHAHIEQIQVLETVELGSAVRLNAITDFGHQREYELGRVELPNKKVYGPLVMSLQARFDDDGTAEEREILFAGAGVSFEERK